MSELKIGDVLQWCEGEYGTARVCLKPITRLTPCYVWCGKKRFKREDVGDFRKARPYTEETRLRDRVYYAENTLRVFRVTEANVEAVERFLADQEHETSPDAKAQ